MNDPHSWYPFSAFKFFLIIFRIHFTKELSAIIMSFQTLLFPKISQPFQQLLPYPYPAKNLQQNQISINQRRSRILSPDLRWLFQRFVLISEPVVTPKPSLSIGVPPMSIPNQTRAIRALRMAPAHMGQGSRGLAFFEKSSFHSVIPPV